MSCESARLGGRRRSPDMHSSSEYKLRASFRRSPLAPSGERVTGEGDYAMNHYICLIFRFLFLYVWETLRSQQWLRCKGLWQYSLTFCLCAFVPLCLCACLCSADVSTEKERFLKVQRDLQQKKALLQESAKKEKRVIDELDKINQQLNQTQRKVGELGGVMKKTQKDIIVKKIALIETHDRLCQKQNELAYRLRAIYKYRKNGVIDIVFSTPNLSDLSRQIYFMTMIAQNDNTLIREIRQQKEVLNCQKQVLQKKHEQLSDTQNEYKQEFVVQKKQERNYQGLLSRVQEEEKLYRQQIAQLNRSSTELTSLIKRLEAQKKAQAQARAIKSKKPQEIDKKYYPEKGTFVWPVAGGRIIKEFGRYKSPKFDTYVENKGVDITAPSGQTVVAVKSGNVVYADWFKGYGMLVMVDHGNGIYSLYAHLANILVRKGQAINAGTPIGTVGETGFATEPCLHFELRVDGQPVNPSGWLRRG
ncbi:peptidoglycan DD-metalloendopeptidase family protein [Candidatus Desantisbacteria bacterium]|nr:peptidoglycan DD-metalloendopeptidase family protein [Candidatus Desantisbacteria bacterium]